MNTRNRAVLSFIITMFLLVTCPSFASAMQYGVAAGDYPSRASAYGTSGSNYVMASPTIVSGHVSSIYVTDSNTTV